MSSERDKTHPVWEVYDLHRDCDFQSRLCSHALIKNERLNLGFDLVIAIAAPGSAIAGLIFWTTSTGKVLWTFFAAVAGTLGAIRPFLKIPDKVNLLQKVELQFRSLAFQLTELEGDIRRAKTYSAEHVEAFKRIQIAYHKARESEPIVSMERIVRETLMHETNSELPASNFYIPATANLTTS